MILNEKELCFTQHAQNRTYFFPLKLMDLSVISFIAVHTHFSVDQARTGIISRGSLPLAPLAN